MSHLTAIILAAVCFPAIVAGAVMYAHYVTANYRRQQARIYGTHTYVSDPWGTNDPWSLRDITGPHGADKWSS